MKQQYFVLLLLTAHCGVHDIKPISLAIVCDRNHAYFYGINEYTQRQISSLSFPDYNRFNICEGFLCVDLEYSCFVPIVIYSV